MILPVFEEVRIASFTSIEMYSLLILIFIQGATQVTAYVPRGVWYEFYSKKSINSNGNNFTFSAPLDTIPLLVRGGSILPAQTPATTTAESRKNLFELLIAPDEKGYAIGELFIDDGDSPSLSSFIYPTICVQSMIHNNNNNNNN